MAPLPPIWDPAKAADKLPQPFRMIDKIASEIIELALAEIAKKAEHRKYLKTINTNTNFAPHAILRTEGDATCFATLGVGGVSVAGKSCGGLTAFSARDYTAIGKDSESHTSAVSAMDTGHISSTGTKVVASASSGHLAVHDVVMKTAELIQLARTELPTDPDDPGAAPEELYFSPNSAHIAVCYSSGALAIYELLLPSRYYISGLPETNIHQAPEPVEGIKEEGSLKLLLNFSVATVKKLLVGCDHVGRVHIVWQLQQRPDKSGRSDRFHKPAKGVYMWWHGCNKLALSQLSISSVPKPPIPGSSDIPSGDANGAAAAVAPPGSKPSTPAPKPVTPSKGAKDAKGGPFAGQDTAPADSEGAGPVARAPDKGWLLPHGITASASTEDGAMLAFGLADGSVLIWDDSCTCHTKILARMPAAICALAYVNGTGVRLFATSTDGTMHVAVLERPEESYTPSVKLPSAAQNVFFLPNDPFAFIILKGVMSYKTEPEPGNVVEQPPHFYWFHMVEQKLVAECVGKDTTETFGSAGVIRQPGMMPDELKPPPPVEEPPPPAKGAKGKEAVPPPAETTETVEPPKMELDPAAPPITFPRWFIKDSYLIAGGQRVKSTSWRPPKGMLIDEVPDEMWPRESVLFLYKLDALSRYLLPEELKSSSAKSMLDRMLADLNPIKKKIGKHVKYDQPDPDAPKPLPGVLRKEGDGEGTEDDDEVKSNISVRKHIMFDLTDDMFDESADKEKKIFKKETVKGGYSQKKDPNAEVDPNNPSKPEPLALAALRKGAAPWALRMLCRTERPKSPPWHHTNPLARIHPDWEEAPVLTRVMDRLGNKGGGRRRRDFNLRIANEELSERLAKEPGAKPRLLPQPKVKA